MIPLLLTVRINWFRLWIPLILLWILLLPLVLVLLPFAALACSIARINPVRTFVVFWQVMSAMPGTEIEVNVENNVVAVRIF
jgi:hypothetical protein